MLAAFWQKFFTRKPQVANRKRGFRPELEVLEERCMPSTTTIEQVPLVGPPTHSLMAHASTLNPSAVSTTLTVVGTPAASAPGQTVSETATLTAADGTAQLGLVAFYANGNFQGYAPLDGVAGNDQATLTSVLLPSGANTIQAVFAGSSGYAGSNASAVQIVTGSAQVVAYAGLSFTDTVTILNPDGSVNTGYTGTVHFTTSDPASNVSLPADYTYQPSDQGVHTFDVTLQTLNYQTVTVTDTVTPSITSTLTVFVVPHVADHLAFLQQPTDTVAGQAIAPAVTVAAEDSLGNVVPTANPQILLIVNGTALFGTNEVFAANGIATFNNLSIQNAGFNYLLQASAVGLTGTTSAPFAILPGPTTQFLVSAPTSVTAGTPFSVTVLADDPYFNLTPNYAGTVHFTSSDLIAQLPSDYTFQPTIDKGGQTFTVTMQTTNVQSITATDTVTSSIAGSANVTVTAGAPIANDDSYGVHENHTVNVPAGIGLLSNDLAFPGQTLTAQLVAGPTHGSLTLNSDGSLSYTPTHGFHGTDTFTYQAFAGSLGSNIATVTLDVHAQNHAPVAQNDSYTVVTGQTLTVASDQGVLANDYDLDGDPISPQLVSGPQHGTLQFNSDGSFLYTPSAGFTGTDTFTYRDFDGLAYSRPATVAIDVQHAISLFPPDDQANNEGDTVSVQFPATDANGLPITYAAIGLPPGLSMDPSTGVITGTVPYTDAETNNGKYAVTLTASDPGDSVSSHFTWFISDTNRLVQPDDQVNQPGDVVSLQLQATGGPFTYGAVGLPPGLSINPTTGVISGPITANPPKPHTYTVTVSATGGGSTDTQQFKWTVVSEAQPYVLIAINDTVATDDDYTINLQPITARVTLYDSVPGEHDVQIVVPSGLSTISGGSLVLSDGQSAEIGINPQQYSQQHNDVVLVAQVDGKPAGQAKETNGKVTVGPVNAADTPAAMTLAGKYRIPPRVVTPVQVYISPTLQNDDLYVQVFGQSQNNGEVSIQYVGDGGTALTKGALFLRKFGNRTIDLVGGSQTEPNNAGNLKLVILRSDKVNNPNEAASTILAVSNGFSVAAIPVDYSVKLQSEITQGAARGILVADSWKSDSGSIADLGAVQISEQVQYISSTGIYAARPAQNINSKYVPANTFDSDFHGSGLVYFQQGGGDQKANQVYIFLDERTGVKDIPMANSGYQITKKIIINGQGKYEITVGKVGDKVTANGYESGAGTTVPAKGIKKTVPR